MSEQRLSRLQDERSKKPSAGRARGDLESTSHYDREPARVEWPERSHVIEIDDVRSVDADKPNGIEQGLHLA